MACPSVLDLSKCHPNHKEDVSNFSSSIMFFPQKWHVPIDLLLRRVRTVLLKDVRTHTMIIIEQLEVPHLSFTFTCIFARRIDKSSYGCVCKISWVQCFYGSSQQHA